MNVPESASAGSVAAVMTMAAARPAVSGACSRLIVDEHIEVAVVTTYLIDRGRDAGRRSHIER
jgi:hypothetical protein